ncbi:MAG: winged helix-turn-helix transcriptional regulator [Candidatus Nitrosocosmicus sp.]
MQSINDHKFNSNNYKDVIVPQIKFVKCPIKTSLGVLGKKWTILIIRDIGFRKIGRFNRLLESIPGLTPRVLSMRLKELEKEGLIECIQKKRMPMIVVWSLTEKGRDILPILLMLSAFSFKWYSEIVFEDKKSRRLKDVFPQQEAKEMILKYINN